MDEGAREIHIRRVNPLGIRSVYVNDFSVIHSPNEVYLTFSQVEPPDVSADQKLADVQTVDAVAVARLVVTPEFAKAIVTTLDENLKRLEEKRK